MAQIVADRLGIDIAAGQAAPGRHRAHRLRLGHLRRPARSPSAAPRCALAAARLGDLLCRIAAHLLDTPPGERRTRRRRRGRRSSTTPHGGSATRTSPTSPTCAHTCCPRTSSPACPPPRRFDVSGDGTFSNATHGVVVELPCRAPARCEILRYACVEDCGVVDQPAGGGGPVPRRHRPGHRRRPVRAGDLRRRTASRRPPASSTTRSRPRTRSPTSP